MGDTLPQNNSQLNIVTLLLVMLALLFSWTFFEVKRMRKLKQKIITRQQNYIDSHKIIIGFQIKDFIIKYSKYQKKGYIELNTWQNYTLFEKIWWKIIGLKHSYKLMFSQKKIFQFISGLKSLPNVQLILYTSLPQFIVDALFSKLKLDDLIPIKNRRYCNLKSKDDHKHAIMVDQHSKRVIILTPSPYDHLYEDQKYFLLTRPNTSDIDYLSDLFKDLKSFLEANQDTDYLHEQLALFKIDYENNYENM